MADHSLAEIQSFKVEVRMQVGLQLLPLLLVLDPLLLLQLLLETL